MSLWGELAAVLVEIEASSSEEPAPEREPDPEEEPASTGAALEI
jgi:hypothetical protein